MAWADGWTIKPTLKRNDESPEFFRAFFLCRSHGRVMLPNYSLFFFAKIAFQLSLQALAGEAEELYTHDGQLSHAPLMRFLRIAEGLNTITRRGEIGTSLPVLGLRPTRWPFLRTTNEPNDDSFTVSPRSRQSVISFKTSSTNVAEFGARQSYLLVHRLTQNFACDCFSRHRPNPLRPAEPMKNAACPPSCCAA